MKRVFLCFYFQLFLLFIFAKSGNNTQILQSGHWVYDDLYTLCMESKQSIFIDNQPLSIGELLFYLKNIDYENLSDNTKFIYDKLYSFLKQNDDFLPEQDVRLFVNLRLNPEFYYKTNDSIDWSFAYNYHDFAFTVPVIIGFSDYITIEPDFFIGKNYYYSQKNDNFINIPFAGNQMEFLFPRFAYGSTGKYFDNWGFNFHVGKEGLKIGNTCTGSIIYNDTFETDAYFQLSFFNNILKYTMDVAQVDNSKYLYLHQLNIHPFSNFKFCMIEGSLLNSSFELRYLNPFMIMHSFGSWYDYKNKLTEQELKLYREGHFCAYLAFTFEYMPFSNIRIYGLYAQNEILDLGGSRSDSALSVPDSLGGQLGIQWNIPLKNNSYLKNQFEAVYTSPYLYVKQSPDWSLFRSRTDMQTKKNIGSWIGSPFGPDTFSLYFESSYYTSDKWSLGASYNFTIHGENSIENLFSKKETYDGVEIYSYYPSVEYGLAETEEQKQDAKNKGRYMWMTGVNKFHNQFTLFSSYSILENLKAYLSFSYNFIFNNLNEEGIFSQGIEFIFGIEYKIFK